MLRTHARAFLLLFVFPFVAISVPQKNPQDELLRAAETGNVAGVEALIAQGADVNQPTRYKTALMRATYEGRTQVVTLLLAKGAQVNTKTDEGTALMEAVRRGHTEIMKVLIAAGADVNAVHRTGDLPLLMAARQRSYKTPPVEPNAEVVQLLLAHGVNPNAKGSWGVTPLMEANTAAKVKLLVASGAKLDATDEAGQTALIKAAARGDVAVVGALLDGGANVNATDNNGSSALLHSLSNENLAHGEERETLPQRRLEVARRLLLARSIDVNAQNTDGESALMRAVRLYDVNTIRLLLSLGADANRRDVFGDTAVTLAYAGGDAEIKKLLPAKPFKDETRDTLNVFLRAAVGRADEARVRELLAYGADPNHEYPVAYTHKTVKRRVLVDAASIGHTGIVQLLLEKGADPNVKGLISGSEYGLKYGTPLEAAEFSKKPDVIALLRKAQPD